MNLVGGGNTINKLFFYDPLNRRAAISSMGLTTCFRAARSACGLLLDGVHRRIMGVLWQPDACENVYGPYDFATSLLLQQKTYERTAAKLTLLIVHAEPGFTLLN